MTQVIPEQQLDLAHIKAALGKFARESGFTYKKNVQLTASLLEFNQKCLVFVPGIVYPAIVIPVRRQGGKSKEETSLIYTFHNGEFNHINNSKYFSCKATESFSWERIMNVLKISKRKSASDQCPKRFFVLQFNVRSNRSRFRRGR